MRQLLLLVPCLAGTPAFAQAGHDFSAAEAIAQQAVSTIPLDGASLVVVKDGAIVLESHYGSYDASTRVPVASASKWVSAVAIGSLVDAGLLRWDSTVGEFIADAPADKRAITLRQLFSHTSGLGGGEGSCLGSQAVTLEECARQILAAPLNWAPGSCFAYGGNSMQVAGRMAEVAAGTRWDALFTARVVAPLGLAATDYAFNSSVPGYVNVPNPRIAGGVRSTARDLVRIAQLFAQRGLFGGQRVLQEATIDFMRADQTGGANYANSPDPTSYGYGIGLWRNRLDGHGNAAVATSPGAFGTTPWLDADAGLAGVFFVRNSNANVSPYMRPLIAAVNAGALLGAPVFADGVEGRPMQQGCTPLR